MPDGWVVIAAGNPASGRGVHFSMPRPLRNRFVHLDLEPDFEEWAVKAGIRPEILAFLRFKPALLHDADATSDLNRLLTEMRVLSMHDAAVRDRAITHTPEFVRFGIEHAEVLQ